MSMTLTQKLKNAIREEAMLLWPEINIPPFDVVEPPSLDFGDLATPLPLTLAKIVGQAPMKIARNIADKLLAKNIEHIADINITAPGYINFKINIAKLSQHLFDKILTQKASFGQTKLEKGKIIIEHTSINPNKSAHIGHLRNACLGDSLRHILEATGWEVEVQNYIDNTGVQIADILVALEKLPDRRGRRKFDDYCWDLYTKVQKLYEVDEALRKRREEILELLETGDNPTSKKALKITNKIVTRHLETMAQFNIAYHLLVWESDIIKIGLWPAVFADLKDKHLIIKAKSGEHQGAWIVEFGTEERQNKVMVKSSGTATYTAKDLAYQLWKFGLTEVDFIYYQRDTALITTPAGTKLITDPIPAERNFGKPQKIINVIDLRQSYPQAVIKSILVSLGFTEAAENYIHLKYNVVRLSLSAIKELGIKPEQDKESYAMSGREGIGIKVDDLVKKMAIKIKKANPNLDANTLNAIAAGTIRYYILRNRPEKEVTFDFAEALRTDGNTGVYLQYAYARCHNILQKVPHWQHQAHKIDPPINLSPESVQIIKLLENYPAVLELAAEESDPSLITDFAFELANSFAKFYEKNPVLQADEQIKNWRLHLVASVKQVLGNVMHILGITALEKI